MPLPKVSTPLFFSPFGFETTVRIVLLTPKPSMMLSVCLFFARAGTVMEELKNAGVDVSPERLQAIMNSQKDLFGGDKGDGGKKE